MSADADSHGEPVSSAATASAGVTSTGWVWAGAASVVFHVGLVMIASVLPDGGGMGGMAKRDQLFTPGAVIPIEALPSATARAEPSPRPTFPSKSAASDLPATSPDPSSGSDRPVGEGSEPPDPTEALSQPTQTPGLSLHGLRDSATASTVGANKVLVDPSLLHGSRDLYEGSIQDPGVGDGAVQGPATAAASGVDYVFSNEKGKLVYRDPSGRFVATLSPDGRVNFRNKGAKATWTNIGMAGPGDALMAAAGDDPYARIKAKLLKATFEMRIGMAVDFQKKQIDKRLIRLDGELGKIWADERRALEDRKELLFQRWDECDEPEEVAGTSELPGFGAIEDPELGSELDEARQTAATSARKRILKFIREHAPKGSAEAFTAQEIADMNGRRVSKQKFTPYE